MHHSFYGNCSLQLGDKLAFIPTEVDGITSLWSEGNITGGLTAPAKSSCRLSLCPWMKSLWDPKLELTHEDESDRVLVPLLLLK